MKPRLEPCDGTWEDQLAWDHALARILRGRTMRSYMGYYLLCTFADRRDAELMVAMGNYGRRRWDMVRECYVFCLPSTLEEWWYWDASGRIEGSCTLRTL